MAVKSLNQRHSFTNDDLQLPRNPTEPAIGCFFFATMKQAAAAHAANG
jgi:hypothetical protein